MEFFGLGILLVYAIGALLALVLTILWIFALIDCLLRRFDDPSVKLIWVLVIIFLHGLGGILYLVVGRSQATRV